MKNTTITIFEYQGSGQKKIAGIRKYGHHIAITKVINITEPLPDFIDEPEDYITSDFQSDMVLCFIKHPDLCDYLAELCNKKNIPMVASGTKADKAITPFTCCGLGHYDKLGNYGRQFGVPEFEVIIKNNMIEQITIKRGASCGATWDVIEGIIGMSVEEALPTIAREVQYLCVADPSAFDPISGKSSLHFAGHVHIAALKKAIEHVTIQQHSL